MGTIYNGPVTVGIELITPQDAANMLKKNGSNRSISNHTLKRYTADMANGNWELNGETIVFYENGELKDGQHRLTSIVNSGTSQYMIVVRGIPKDIYIHDRGRGRSTSDIMDIAGYDTAVKNTSSVGAVKFLFTNLYGMRDITDHMTSQFVDKYGKHLAIAYSACNKSKEHAICKKSPIIAALFCASYCGVSQEILNEFCKCVNTGFYSGDAQTAAIVFRNMVEKTLYSGNTTGRIEMFSYTLMALSDFINGNKRIRQWTQIKESHFAKKVLDECFEDWK